MADVRIANGEALARTAVRRLGTREGQRLAGELGGRFKGR